jgi:putative membrane protein
MIESHTHVQMWPALAITIGLACTALVYLRGWLSLRGAFPTLIAGWRVAVFMTGLLAVWITVASPFAMLDHQSLTLHMVKHLLLMTIAAPLILVGAPAFPLACGLPKLFIRKRSLIASIPKHRLKSIVTHPVFCWVAGTIAVIGWHLPAAFQLGMHSRGVHMFEDGSFLVAGLLFWWPILQSPAHEIPSPRWMMALYLFFAAIPCDILSAFLVFCNRLVYAFYLSKPQLVGISALEDQECAGALMWVWVTFAYLIPAVALTLQMLSPSNPQSGRMLEGVTTRSENDAEAEVL